MSVEIWAEQLSVSLGGPERRVRVRADGLSVAAGELVALTGESGSGKTLLLETLGLLRRPDPGARFGLTTEGGTIDLAAAWAPGGDPAALRRRHFGFVPQSGGLLGFLDLEANVALAQKLAGQSDDDYRDLLLDALDLRTKKHVRPDALSIGERQRVAIARALVHRPAVVIADEPTASLDPHMAGDVLALFIELAASQGTAVLMSTHDLVLAKAMGLRRIALQTHALDPHAAGVSVETRIATAGGPHGSATAEWVG